MVSDMKEVGENLNGVMSSANLSEENEERVSSSGGSVEVLVHTEQ